MVKQGVCCCGTEVTHLFSDAASASQDVVDCGTKNFNKMDVI
jgi:hypothetical protein